MKYYILFIVFILLGAYESSYAKEPVTHTHNGRTHTHFLPLSGLNHHHGVKKEILEKTDEVRSIKKGKASTFKKKPKIKKQKEGNIAPANQIPTAKKNKVKVVVRRTPATNPLSGSPTDCVVKVTITSDTNFTSMTTDRGGGADSLDAYPVYVQRMYILNADTGKTDETVSFTPPTRKNVTDHRTGKKYSMIVRTFPNILDGYTYTATLGAGWITEPRSVTFHCPNANGEREFSLPPIKHIGIMGDG